MDLRTRTTLLCGALALAIAASILLRKRRRTLHLLFAMFAGDTGFWYLSQSFYGMWKLGLWDRLTGICAILLPLLTLFLFEAIVPHSKGEKPFWSRAAGVLAIPLITLELTPQYQSYWVREAIFLYAFGLLAAGLGSLAQRARKITSVSNKRRVIFLVIVGALAGAFSLADFLWFIGAKIPPVGAVLSIVFLFLLAESLQRERLLDLYEMVGKLVVSTALAFLLAGIFYLFVTYLSFNTMYLNAVLASIVILVLFEPLRAWVEARIHGAFFRERLDLENAVIDARRQLVHVLEVEELHQVVLTALERSRHATTAGLYLIDKTGTGFDLAGSFGSPLPRRIEVATSRILLDKLGRGPVLLDEVTREIEERKPILVPGASVEVDALMASGTLLGVVRGGTVIGIRTEPGEIVGFLVVVDERVHEPMSVDDLTLLESLASQIGVVLQNSLTYKRMQERDRLAAIGQMATRLAHEVKNPLGAIKGAAQILAEPGPGTELDPGTREFVAIILEEVDRLDRVVGSVLDYARPSKGNPGPVDVNAVVRRTVQILASDRSSLETVDVEVDLAEELSKVRIDAEQLRQVLMNLARNAIQAMNGRGRVVVRTRPRAGGRDPGGWVELSVSDSGPGISQKVLKNLFVPFFTTKNQGTGLGLAICNRIIQGASGTIEVQTHEGAGTTFTVVLPAFDAPLAAAASTASSSEAARHAAG